MQYASYHDLLDAEFNKRKQTNASYSLRAFARDIDLSPSRLSQVFNRKQGLSIDAAQKIAERLSFSEKKKQWFCSSVGALHARAFKERKDFKQRVELYKDEAKIFSELQLEYFKVISDWHHFAILELTHLEGFQNDQSWIAQVLDITEEQVHEAIERMKLLELVVEKDGKLVDAFKFLATPCDTPSDALKKFHSQLLEKALRAQQEQDVNSREFSSNILAVDKNQMPLLKEKLRDLRRELDHMAGKMKNKNAVYCLGLQFYELTRGDRA